jgi:Do/DeqQ family serine protease
MMWGSKVLRGVISAVFAAVFTWSVWTAVGAGTLGQNLPVTADGHSPFVGVVQQVKDAVVNISAEINRQNQERDNQFGPLFEDLFPWHGSQRQRSLGSGFLISGDGLILTNNHVVQDAEKITVRLSDKSEFSAEVVGIDEATDLALLRIQADHDLPFMELGDSDSLLVGDWVIAIGNPFPQQGLDRTVTVGVISALGRTNLNFAEGRPDYQNYIQTDASINPGNSGGPLINLAGHVVGINSALASPTGANVGIGFAIPINFAKMVIPDLKSSGKVSRGGLGIQLRDLTWDDVEAEDLPSADGALINSVIAGTPADRAKLKPGDVIVAFDGEKIKDAQHFMRLIWMARADTDVTLSVIRNGQSSEVPVRLGDRETVLASANDNDLPAPSNKRPARWLGLSVETNSPQAADRMNTTYRQGVVVVDIDPDGPAYEKGIRTGMVIGEIDHQVLMDIEDYNRVVGSLAGRKKAVSLLVYDRRGNTGYIAVRPEYNP